MSGNNVGTLNVTYVYPGADIQQGFTLSGDQGNQWTQGFLGISTPYEEFNIIVLASVGTGYRGDIALDDFKLSPFTCSDVQRQTNQTGIFFCGDSSNTTVPMSKVCNWIRDCESPYMDEANCGICGFQDDFCQWTEDSNGIVQWLRGSGQSHANYSAPMYDHNGNPSRTETFFFLFLVVCFSV